MKHLKAFKEYLLEVCIEVPLTTWPRPAIFVFVVFFLVPVMTLLGVLLALCLLFILHGGYLAYEYMFTTMFN